MVKAQARYFSYLLRVWRDDDEDQAAWRMSLDTPLTGQRQGFGSLDDLATFLRQQMDALCEGDDDVNAVTGDDAANDTTSIAQNADDYHSFRRKIR